MSPATDDAPSGRATDSGNAASTAEVRAMFDKIARVYDPMNLVISAFQEPRWRKRAVKLTGARPGDRILDVATGTGKVAADLHAMVQPGGSVLGVDISPAMIRVAQKRFAGRAGLSYVVGDALALPTEDGSFDAATLAFGMRNLPDYGKGFAELARSVRPGGRVVCLELSLPRLRTVAMAYHAAFRRSAPLMAALVGGSPEAYRYLPESLDGFPDADDLAQTMRSAGLVDVRFRRLAMGVVALHFGRVGGAA
jgi:demethylmenaquinone methyltransferase/2-methoxy-6-polyprenyl-1,4-benzoquinol methylase